MDNGKRILLVITLAMLPMTGLAQAVDCNEKVDGISICAGNRIRLTIIHRDGTERFNGRFPTMKYCEAAIKQIHKHRYWDSAAVANDEKLSGEPEGPTDIVDGRCSGP